jgi:hypothetical protein
MNSRFWCHAKSIPTLETLLKLKANCFFHNKDDCVLTSQNKIWIYPGKRLVKNSIAVLPETVNYSIDELKICKGICSDIIQKYKEIFK